MTSYLRKAYRVLFKRGNKHSLGNVRVGKNSRCTDLNVVVRNCTDNTPLIEIGDDSLVAGSFVIEKTGGYIKVGNRTFIGGGNFISIVGIEIGDDVMFSWGCTVMDNDAHSLKWNERKQDVADWKRGLEEGKAGFYKNWDHVKARKVIVKSKAWIGFNSIILKGVTIGEGAVVGAGSVVTQDVPDFAIVAGNPAKIIKYINSES